MAKTPFELRYDALQLARNHMMERFYADLDIYRTNSERGVSIKTLTLPEYPTPEDVMELATKFKDFVDDKRA